MRRAERSGPDAVAAIARDVIEVERWIGARPETVFTYFTDPVRFLRWHGEDASIEPRPGGAVRMSLGGPSGPVVRGELLEVVAPRKLVFTYGWEGASRSGGPSIVEISLESKGGGTLLRLRQTASSSSSGGRDTA